MSDGAFGLSPLANHAPPHPHPQPHPQPQERMHASREALGKASSGSSAFGLVATPQHPLANQHAWPEQGKQSSGEQWSREQSSPPPAAQVAQGLIH
jgi:hypothetical protein